MSPDVLLVSTKRTTQWAHPFFSTNWLLIERNINPLH